MGESIALLWWLWVVVAVIFLVVEVLTSRFILLAFGVGAAFAAILAFLGMNLIAQLLAFTIISAIGALLLRPLTRKVTIQAENVYGAERVIGKEAVVTVAIDPETMQGRVHVEHEVWLADSEDGTPIPDGATVQVLAINGSRLRVRPLPNERLPRSSARGQDWS